MMEDNKDGFVRILGVLIVMSVFMVFWQYLFPLPKTETPKEKAQADLAVVENGGVVEGEDEDANNIRMSAKKGASGDVEIKQAADTNMPKVGAEQIKFGNEKITGYIDLMGASIDGLTLVDYKDNVVGEEPVHLFYPAGTKNEYYVSFNWLAMSGGVTQADLPNAKTVWSSNASFEKGEKYTKFDLTKEPLILTHKNKLGQTFIITITLDEGNMFTVTQKVLNNGSQAVEIYPYAQIKRHISESESKDGFVGAVGTWDNSFKNVELKKLKKEDIIEKDTKGSFVGFSDKYWLTAIAPSVNSSTDLIYALSKKSNGDEYIKIAALEKQCIVEPNGEGSSYFNIFVGPKDIDLLDKYSKEYDIKLLDHSIEFGKLYFICKPMLLLLRFINNYVGNYGIAIIIMTIIIRGALFPLSNKSYKSMKKMRDLGPKLAELKVTYADDQKSLNQAMIDLYRKEDVSPIAGIWPLVLQLPIFFALYRVLYTSIEMRHSPFFGWITDLAAPDPTNIFNLFGLLHFTPPSFLHVGVLPLIMGLTMFIQQILAPTTMDNSKMNIMKYLPVVFIFIFARFPTGLLIYWTMSNVLSIIQQQVSTKFSK